MVKKIINSHKSIIILNGDFDLSLLKMINTKVPIIAADGALNKVYPLLKPHYVIGDGDSVSLEKTNEIESIHVLDQDMTDFEKCILFLTKQNLLPILVLGINGGEIDHILGNFQTIMKYSHHFSLYFLDSYKREDFFKSLGVKLGFVLPEKQVNTFEIKEGSLISLIPFNELMISSKGLQWELNNTLLSMNSILGLRNKNISPKIEFKIKKGKVLAIIDISYL